jgi:endothelin-converting enzyme/putative endopeptidase
MKLIRTLCILALSLLINTASRAQTSSEPALPYSPSLNLESIDKSIDPCVNLYQYACGRWQKENPIPADQTSWGVYGKLYEDNLKFLRGILEQVAATDGQRDAVNQKIGDFYAACVDETAIEKRGMTPITPELDRIAALKSVHDFAPLIARLQLASRGRSMLFAGGADQDPDNSEQIIAVLDQGGLGLPDRDYYTKDDAKSKEIRERYVQHVQKMFELLGDDPATAKTNAQIVMRIETSLAKASLTQVERRDPYKLKNKMDLPGLKKLAPNFDWDTYYADLHYPAVTVLQRGVAFVFQEDEQRADRHVLGQLEDIFPISRRRRLGALSFGKFRRGKLRLLSQVSSRSLGDAAAMEALRAVRRP